MHKLVNRLHARGNHCEYRNYFNWLDKANIKSQKIEILFVLGYNIMRLLHMQTFINGKFWTRISGPKIRNILKSIIEQKLFRIMLLTICNFHFFAKRPHKGVTEWPLKYSLPNITKTIENFWTLVEQELFEISTPLILYQEKGAGPLNQGSKRVQSLFRISFYLSIFWYKL